MYLESRERPKKNPVLDIKFEVPIEEERRSKLEKSTYVLLYVFIYMYYSYVYTARIYVSILSAQNHVKALLSH